MVYRCKDATAPKVQKADVVFVVGHGLSNHTFLDESGEYFEKHVFSFRAKKRTQKKTVEFAVNYFVTVPWHSTVTISLRNNIAEPFILPLERVQKTFLMKAHKKQLRIILSTGIVKLLANFQSAHEEGFLAHQPARIDFGQIRQVVEHGCLADERACKDFLQVLQAILLHGKPKQNYTPLHSQLGSSKDQMFPNVADIKKQPKNWDHCRIMYKDLAAKVEHYENMEREAECFLKMEKLEFKNVQYEYLSGCQEDMDSV